MKVLVKYESNATAGKPAERSFRPLPSDDGQRVCLNLPPVIEKQVRRNRATKQRMLERQQKVLGR